MTDDLSTKVSEFEDEGGLLSLLPKIKSLLSMWRDLRGL